MADAATSTTPIVTIAGERATIRLNRPREHNRIEPGGPDRLEVPGNG